MTCCPMHAILHAQSLIVSGIDYILDNSEYNLVIPCHSWEPYAHDCEDEVRRGEWSLASNT